METIMIRSTTVKKGNILRGKLPLQILFLCQWKTRNYASKSKKLLDQKRSNDSNVLRSINHDLIASSSPLLITIDNNFHWKYNRWTNTDQNLNTFAQKQTNNNPRNTSDSHNIRFSDNADKGFGRCKQPLRWWFRKNSKWQAAKYKWHLKVLFSLQQIKNLTKNVHSEPTDTSYIHGHTNSEKFCGNSFHESVCPDILN